MTHRIDLTNVKDAEFDPHSGILSFSQPNRTDLIRIPRTQFLSTTSFTNIWVMSFKSPTRTQLAINFNPAEYPDLHAEVSWWWVRGRKPAQPSPPDRA